MHSSTIERLLLITSTLLIKHISSAPTSTIQQTSPTTTRPPHLFNSRETHSTESSEEYAWYYTDEDYSEETSCPENEFWHIRGKRCVPFTCPRANWLRDWKTGECLYTPLGPTGEIKTFGRSAFMHRKVMRPVRYRTAGRTRPIQSRWQTVNQRKRVTLDDDTANPIRTVGLIG